MLQNFKTGNHCWLHTRLASVPTGCPARSCESSPPDMPPKKRVHFSNFVEVRTYDQDETDALE